MKLWHSGFPGLYAVIFNGNAQLPLPVSAFHGRQQPIPRIVGQKLDIITFSHTDAKDISLDRRNGIPVRIGNGQGMTRQAKIIYGC